MPDRVRQSNNTVTGGDVVAGDKHETNYIKPPTRLSSLFDRLKLEFSECNQVGFVADNLRRYTEPRDIIGLEQKLKDAEKEYLLEDALWLKQEYRKKMEKFQFFESAAEIHAILLSVVMEKFRNLVYPKMRTSDCSDEEIQKTISTEIVGPIVRVIEEEGCNDIMGLNADDIEGMVFFLTGLCHLKWCQNDSISPSV